MSPLDCIESAAPAAPQAAPAAAAHGRASLFVRAGELIFTTDFRQRRCIKMLFLTALIYTICSVLAGIGVYLGMFILWPMVVMVCFSFGSTCLFYIIFRSGRNQRLAEPTMALQQALVAQTMIAGSYAITGPAHGGLLILLALVMVFGMFNMRVATARLVSAYSILIIGLVMIWRTRSDPVNYPAHLEIVYFVLVATVLPSLSQLSEQMMSMRARLKAQRAELESALAHIQEMATHDELTGLSNRRHMMNLMKEHALRRARGGHPFYIAMVDLDHFKQVNDTYGHAVGDEVLRVFAHKAREILRNTDVVGRWGGEEFLLLLPETPPGEPTIGVGRLREHLAQAQVCAALPQLRVAFSAGFARYQEGERIDQTIERADRALYAAKSAGRNQTVVL
jgi:diguanylate cyclase (GGDEF)-like protein